MAKAPASKASVAQNVPKDGRPTYTAMIKEALSSSKDKTGLSRSAIKKYLLDKYKVESNGTSNTHIATSIKRGVEDGTFSLPKGLAGKVKLGSGKPIPTGKENQNPVSKGTVTKNAKFSSKSGSKKSATPLATKKVAAKKPTDKKTTGKPMAKASATPVRPVSGAQRHRTLPSKRATPLRDPKTSLAETKLAAAASAKPASSVSQKSASPSKKSVPKSRTLALKKPNVKKTSSTTKKATKPSSSSKAAPAKSAPAKSTEKTAAAPKAASSKLKKAPRKGATLAPVLAVKKPTQSSRPPPRPRGVNARITRSHKR